MRVFNKKVFSLKIASNNEINVRQFKVGQIPLHSVTEDTLTLPKDY